MTVSQKVFSQKEKFNSGKKSLWETVFWETTLLGNCPSGKLSSGKLSFWETTFWETDPLGNCRSGKLPTGKNPLGNCILGNYLWENS